MSNLFRDNLYNEFPDPNKKIDEIGEQTEQLQSSLTSVQDVLVDIGRFPKLGGEVNDTLRFKRAFDFLKARGGGLVSLPASEFVVSNIKIPSYCGIKGIGRKSILRAEDNSGVPVIELEASDTKFTYLSDFSILGNKTNQTSQNAKGILYNGSETGSKDIALNEWDARHTITNIFIKETKGIGFEISGRGESQIDNVQVRDCADYGFYFNSFDNWVSNISSGSNLKTGIVITSKGGSSRYINCKSWNNGQGAASVDDTYGFKLTGVQGAILSACDAQANLNHGVYMSDIRGCFIHVNSELNGSRGLGLVTVDSAGFYLDGGMFNNIIGTCRNIRNDQQIQDYAVTLAGTANANTVNITSMAMNKGGVNDTNNRLSSNNVSVIADTADYTDVSSRTKRYDSLGVGTGANKNIAPLWVTSKDTDNAQGALIQRTTTTSSTDNTLITTESINGASKVTLKIKANITNQQVIYDTGTNEARFTAKIKSNDKVIGATGLGVGNSAAATTLGTVTKKMEVFDANGTSLGFVPIYNSIT